VKNQIKKIHIKIRMEECVMRVSTKICLEKEKKTPASTKNKEKNPL
jgi:hypothetical protein